MLQTILSILSVLIAAVGIPILYLQLKDVKATVRSSAHSAIYNQAETLRGYLIEYPHLRNTSSIMKRYNLKTLNTTGF